MSIKHQKNNDNDKFNTCNNDNENDDDDDDDDNQCSSQSAPLRESRKRSRDGPHQKRSRAIMALSFYNSVGLKVSLLLQLQ